MTLRFERVTLENFGPYRGRQEIGFNSERGVWIFYGANGRGKTKLHNAFRFALYGEIRGRTGLDPPATLCNRPNAELDGFKSMAVDVDFVHDGRRCHLRRSFDERDSDRPLKLSLEIDGNVLARGDAEAAIRTIFDPAMAQFFLLDAEDLRPYENLTGEASEDGRRLKDAIESLLGIPLLRAAANGVDVVRREAQKQIQAQANADKQMKDFADGLRDASSVKENLQELQDAESESLAARRDELDSVERILSDNEVAQQAFGELEAAREELRRSSDALTHAKADLSAVLGSTWTSVISFRARQQRDLDTIEMRERHNEEAAANTANTTLVHLNQAETCPTCGHRLSSDEIHDLRLSAESTLTDIGLKQERVSRGLGELTTSIAALNRVLDMNKSDLLRERENSVNDQSLAVETAKLRVEAATEILGRFDEIDVRDLTRRHHNLGLQIENSVARLSEIEDQIQEQTTAIDKIRFGMKQMGFQPDPDVARAEAISARLGLLFTRAAEAYRTEIKERVEADASDVFREISSEPDYERLQINDQFGLAILDSSGRPVEGRSAGYEHLVALALISALQRNAPVQGPVVMDNPFLRLDESHTRNVVTALPEVSAQLILLTFPGEFDRDEAVAALGDHLVAEFHLERLGHEETQIAIGPHGD